MKICSAFYPKNSILSKPPKGNINRITYPSRLLELQERLNIHCKICLFLESLAFNFHIWFIFNPFIKLIYNQKAVHTKLSLRLSPFFRSNPTTSEYKYSICKVMLTTPIYGALSAKRPLPLLQALFLIYNLPLSFFLLFFLQAFSFSYNLASKLLPPSATRLSFLTLLYLHNLFPIFLSLINHLTSLLAIFYSLWA